MKDRRILEDLPQASDRDLDNCRKRASVTMPAVSSMFRQHFSMHPQKSATSLSLDKC
jgi:hypothetical protein